MCSKGMASLGRISEVLEAPEEMQVQSRSEESDKKGRRRTAGGRYPARLLLDPGQFFIDAVIPLPLLRRYPD